MYGVIKNKQATRSCCYLGENNICRAVDGGRTITAEIQVTRVVRVTCRFGDQRAFPDSSCFSARRKEIIRARAGEREIRMNAFSTVYR